MSRWTLAGLALMVSGIVTVPAAVEKPLPPGVRVERSGGIATVSGVMPGTVHGYAFVRTVPGESRRDLVMLIGPLEETPTLGPDASVEEPAEDPETEEEVPDLLPPCPEAEEKIGAAMKLVRFDPTGGRGLDVVMDDIPHHCSTLQPTDPDGDGRDDLLVGCRGAVLQVRWDDGRVDRVIEKPEQVWRFLRPSDPAESDTTAVVGAARLGSLDLYRPGEDGAPWSVAARIELPIDGEVGVRSLRIRSEVPVFLNRGDDGSMLFVTRPVDIGPRQIRSRLIEASPAGESRITESWSSLPEPEDILESRYLVLDGKPILFVTTKPRGKLSLFGEKRLRLFALERDRSRLGAAPVFATESRMNLWQEAMPVVLDVNRDGREDLVVGYWKGLVDDKFVLDVYLRETDGSFRRKPRTTAYNVKDGLRDRLYYGRDLDGDRVPDLMLQDQQDFLIFPGLPSPDGKRVVSDEPLRVERGDLSRKGGFVAVELPAATFRGMELGTATGDVRLVDVDGDGTMEILALRRGRSANYPGLARVFWVGSDPEPAPPYGKDARSRPDSAPRLDW